MTVTRGKKHDHPGMDVKFMMNGAVQIGMPECAAKMIKDFPIKFTEFKEHTHPAGVDVFKEDLT